MEERKIRIRAAVGKRSEGKEKVGKAGWKEVRRGEIK